jgi:hypothetical protein
VSPLRRGLLALAAGSLVAAVPVASPASAASTFSCPGHAGKAYVLAVGATSGTDLGYLWAYNYSAPSTDTVGTFGTRVKIGSGWNGFSAVRAGKDGWIWAFKTDGSIYYYDWNVGPTSTTWSISTGTQPAGYTPASAPWKSYATSTYRSRIAVDAGNNIYILDTSGRVRKYTYDVAGKKWTNFGKVVASPGTAYNMLWVSDQNTLYARNADSNVLRIRLDPGADRQVTRTEGYPGWNSYKYVSSAGGDTLYGVGTTSGLRKWRYVEDTNTWPSSLAIGSGAGWPAFLDVTTIGNSCVRSYPATSALATPTVTDAPLEALGSQNDGRVGVALANGVGGLRFATFDPTNNGTLSWPADSNDGQPVTGQPALTMDPTNKFHVFSHETTGVTKEKSQVTADGSSALGTATAHGGIISGTTDAAKLSDGTTVLAAADSAGVVWVRQEYGGVWTSWRQAATGARPSAPVTATATATGQATLAYPLATGEVGAVVVTNGATVGTPVTLSAPGTALGTSGRVSALAYPGGALRLAVTDSDGRLWTRAQDIASKAWATDWTEVTLANGATVVGDPAVVLSPTSSRVQILVRRSGDDRLALSSESSQGSGVFSPVDVVNGGPETALVTSPTTYTYLDPNNGSPVRRWGVVAYDIDRNVVDFHTTSSTPSPTGRSTGTAEDTLVGRVIGSLPKS